MIAYKGFNKDLVSILGNGIKEKCQFEIGKTMYEETSKTAKGGYHCCENPFECTTYYDLNGVNRFFMVEAAGDIDEDDLGRIACTEITLLKELTPLEFALEGMKYIINHPNRKDWRSGKHRVKVKQDEAETGFTNYIAIARGKHPKVKGAEGSILGLILEPEEGEIVSAKLFVPDRQQAGKWFTIDTERNLLEVQDEEKTD